MEENKYARAANRPVATAPLNGKSKIPVIICVDRSGSMHNEVPNTGKKKLQIAYECIMEDFIGQLLKDSKYKYLVDLAVVAFGNEAKTVKSFHPITDEKHNMKIKGITEGKKESGDLEKGVKESLKILQQQKDFYLSRQVHRKAAWLIIISDGRPSIGGDTKIVKTLPRYEQMFKKLKECEEDSNMNIIPVCIYEGDPSKLHQDKGYKYMCSLTQRNSTNNNIPVFMSDEDGNSNVSDDIKSFFRNLSSSVRAGNASALMRKTNVVVKPAPAPSGIPHEPEHKAVTSNFQQNDSVSSYKEEPRQEVDVEPKPKTEEKVEPEVKEIDKTPEKPSFTIYLNSEKAISNHLTPSDEYIDGFILYSNSNNSTLEVERNGFGKLQFENNEYKFILSAKGKYEIYITRSNVVVVVLKESYDSAPKVEKVEKHETNESENNDPLSVFDIDLDAVVGFNNK